MVMGSLPADQAIAVLRWLLLLTLASAMARPLVMTILREELTAGPTGWIFAKTLGWLVVGWVPWFLASFHILPFHAASWTGLLVLGVSALLLKRPRWNWRSFLLSEAGFLCLFWLGLASRLALADLSGLEKFTDMGFVAAAMWAESMPPMDVWFAGAITNYYFIGHAMVAAWGNLTAMSGAHTYQLGMATLFAFTGLGSFALVASIVAPFGRRMVPVLGGFATLLVLYAGNFHSALYTLFRGAMPTTKPEFYFPDSTRFIGFDPETADKGFTEFPAYGFAVGDLHAHVIAIPVFLFGLAVILSMMSQVMQRATVSTSSALGLGWVIGVLATMNSWDVVNLSVVALVAACVGLTRSGGVRLFQRLDSVGSAAVFITAAAAVAAAPFLAEFQPFSHGLAKTLHRTPIWQLLVIYGHTLPALAVLALAASRRCVSGAGPLTIAVLAVSALILVAVPEEVFVMDIYGVDYARANTMFKLSFRAQHLLILAAVAALAPLSVLGGRWAFAAVLATAPLIATLAYIPHTFKPPWVIQSLDGWQFLGAERGLVAAAAQLPLAPNEAIIEASGASFTEFARVSAMTGLPTPIGWVGHQWLWRQGPGAATARAEEVKEFYTTASTVERCRTIRRYQLRYAILGEVETRAYPAADFEGIATLGIPVYAGAGGKIIAFDPDRCPK